MPKINVLCAKLFIRHFICYFKKKVKNFKLSLQVWLVLFTRIDLFLNFKTNSILISFDALEVYSSVLNLAPRFNLLLNYFDSNISFKISLTLLKRNFLSLIAAYLKHILKWLLFIDIGDQRKEIFIVKHLFYILTLYLISTIAKTSVW